jgi:nucleoside-diphosphate-sugar epimerase
MPKVLAGRKVSVLGRTDLPHSMSYMPDVVRTLVTIADDERAWGRAWHVPNAPARTQAQMVQALAAAAGTTVKVGTVPAVALRMLGLFNPTIKGLRETEYQFSRPFVTDSTLTERTLGLTATSVEEAAAATVAWWRGEIAN